MRYLSIVFISLVYSLSSGCKVNNDHKVADHISAQEDTIIVSDTISKEQVQEVSETILRFKEYGLVNVLDLSPDILVELKYATTDNFTGEIAYTDFTEAWLMEDVAERLARVQDYLSDIRPGYKLLIYDAARPLSVQQKLFDSVKGTPKARYVANPKNTGLHNYGAAVDLTIVDSLNIPLDMGTPFDHLGREAHTDTEQQLMAEGVLNRQQIKNRQLLREVMHKEGFRVLKREWWHFNACTLTQAKQKYKLLDF